MDKRKAFYLVFLAACLFCAASISKVEVNNDITSYLPPETETRRGLSLMEEEFTTLGSARVMAANITYEQAARLAEALEEVEGVAGVVFDGTEDHYQNASALFDVSFEEENDTEGTSAALAEVEALLEPYDSYVVSGDGMSSDVLAQEMSVILLIAAVVIVAVLLFTSKSYLEVLVFLIVFVVSALLNMGTNFIFGSISFITNSIAVVLQLALAIDYAIIFCHRYMEERELLDAREADISSLSKAIVEISSSSLTTISGLVALMLMQFRIGFDMGIVLSKGIVCSMLTVFLLMPGLLMLFNRGIEATRHKNFVPQITVWGRVVMKLRFVLPVLFVAVTAACVVFSNRCDYVFSTNSTNSGNKPAYRVALDKINDTFGYSNTIAVLVPRGDYRSEGALLRRVEAMEPITSATGLANIEVEEGRFLTDELTPRQFSELAALSGLRPLGGGIRGHLPGPGRLRRPSAGGLFVPAGAEGQGGGEPHCGAGGNGGGPAGAAGHRPLPAPGGALVPAGVHRRPAGGKPRDLRPFGPDSRCGGGVLWGPGAAGGQLHQRPGFVRVVHWG